MIQLKAWPPPDNWIECVVTWAWLMSTHGPPDGTVNKMYEWCDQYPSVSRYHVHGWRSTEGFSFKFEDPRDAVVFKLRWPYE